MDTAARAELPTLLFIKKLLHYLSLASSFCLVLLSVLGFQQLARNSLSSFEQVESTTSDGCLLFLGVTFGALLFLGEFKWELFFFFFGFLRYRFGRAIVYAVSGIMTILMGRTRSSCTECTSYSLLLAEGIALLAVSAFQLVAIAPFGNTTAPPAVERQTNSKTALTTLQRDVAREPTVAAPPPPPVFEAKTAPPESPASPKNPNMPSWMQA
ncbi:hypothetical protein LEN26_010660 [Aphanomyces euteiches]|nr:hypothetical protein LEN26_010660 [Aphanomyces euteiches]